MRKTPKVIDAAGKGGGTSIDAQCPNCQWRGRWVLLLLVLWMAAGCAPGPVAAPPPPQPTAVVPATYAAEADVALPALLLAERNAAAARDLVTLGSLWAEEGSVHETRGTDATGDDYHWQGRAAVLNRYRVAVFANPPLPLEAAPVLAVVVAGEMASAESGVDKWRFVQRDGRWWLLELEIAP